MSVPELVEHLGLPRGKVNASLTTARTNHPGKLFRIVSFRTQVGVQDRETPVYAAGSCPDAPRLTFDNAPKRENKRRYYQKNRAMLAARCKHRAGLGAASPWAELLPMQSRRSPERY